MVRFFVEEQLPVGARVMLDEANSAHARVLRLKAGEEVLLCDGRGMESVCTVVSAESGNYMVESTLCRSSVTEPRVFAAVYMALPKADKLEHVIQKATELGAAQIVTFPTARCVSRPDEKSMAKKLERWQKIAASAAEQSGRGMIPKVLVLKDLKAALAHASAAEKKLVFYENEHATTLQQALAGESYGSVSLLSGPEGGFEEWEIEQARQMGFSICTLGNRILRCETAPLCALSAVMYDSGEF